MSKQVKVAILQEFTVNILNKLGVSPEDAEITSDVLVSADMRGIESHGVARLKRYVDGINSGVILPYSDLEIIKETPVSLVIDGKGGLGQPIAHKVMKMCIKKVKENYMCFASVRNSNHYGIAGYYTKLALDEDLIGISSTNSAPLVVPTNAKDAIIGTNPISIGIPAKNEKPFLLDMATSTVSRGKLEGYARDNKEMPPVWATDESGVPTKNAQKVLDNVLNRSGGGLLPLGGAEELTGGHKGYGLSAIVDIFSGILSSGAVGSDLYKDKNAPSGVCHFLGAINPEAFVGIDEIKHNLDRYMKMLKSAEMVEGKNRVYVAGEKEYELEEKNRSIVSIQNKVFGTLNEIGKIYNLKLDSL